MNTNTTTNISARAYDPECIRKVSNWSKLLPEHKFDKSTFKPDDIIASLPMYSPKMNSLLETIREIDEQDMKKYGHHFKHFIFSEVKQGGYGTRVISSSLIAHGFRLGYDEKRRVLTDDQLLQTRGTNFMLLSSTNVFDDALTVKTKKEILAKYNSRPENVHGDLVRFIVMDAGFKEGVDLFDVKYVHIFEPQTSKADQKQVIGRGTRTCGQKGLEFHPTQGWPLQVFVYDVSLPKPIVGQDTLFKLYVETKGIDIRKMRLADELEKNTIVGSVDYELNKNIHMFKIEDDTDYFHQIFEGGSILKCNGRCGTTRTTKDVPIGTALMLVAFFALKRNFEAPESKPRKVLCQLMKTDKAYCKALQEIYTDHIEFIKRYEKPLQTTMKKHKYYMVPQHIRSAFRRVVYSVLPKPIAKKRVKPETDNASLNSVVDETVNSVNANTTNTVPSTAEDETIQPPPTVPDDKLTFSGVREHIREHFMSFAWPKVKLENMCGDSARGGRSHIVEFTPTQNFIRNFFRPESPMRGMLLWHSVGTGKTCAAIATASSSFEREGYTILWVTRTTLKSDIWKNMFDQVCNLVIQERMKHDESFRIPSANDARMRLLSKAWGIRPMSYKQFSNLVAGKNALYNDLVKRNGQQDPLRKTLLIIDEAHKLYGGSDLSVAERPNMEKLTSAIYKSYRVSGHDSVRLLMMTATPYTNDPMELIKLINMCKHADLRIPDTYESFEQRYLTPDGAFTKKGTRAYLDDIAGHVSYLNRERDARQFAQPVVTTVHVPISDADVSEEDLRSINENIQLINDEMLQKKRYMTERRTHVLEEKKKHRDSCAPLKREERMMCMQQSDMMIKAIEESFEKEKQEHDVHKEVMKGNIEALKQKRKQVLVALENDMSQRSMISKHCIQGQKRSARKSSSQL